MKLYGSQSTLWILAILFFISSIGCEIIGPEARKVPYLLEAKAEYSFNHDNGIVLTNETLSRFSFDVPFDAEISIFRIKNIKLRIENYSGECKETFVTYAVADENEKIGAEYSTVFNNRPNNAQDVLFDAFISNQFDKSLSRVSDFVSKEIMAGRIVKLKFGAACNEFSNVDKGSYRINIDYDLIVEYTVCEDVFESPELDPC